ncbi:MAG TPA: hypothetical protein VFF60_02025 [Candidatus Binatus sp.]|nr:hypothetical protein [Candidatus Binatus sp.]
MDLAGRSPRTTPSPMLSPKSHAERSRIYARLRAASERIRVANERAVGLLVEVMDLRRSFDEMIQSLATITDSRAKMNASLRAIRRDMREFGLKTGNLAR